MEGITNGLSAAQINSFLLLDEVYVKPGYQYSGGVMHSSAEDKADEKARTILAIMVNFLFGGSKFVFKIHPVHTLDNNFLRARTFDALEKLEGAGITTRGIIVDNNKVNQKCFKSMADDPKKPYIMSRNESNHYLFKDPTHIHN